MLLLAHQRCGLVDQIALLGLGSQVDRSVTHKLLFTIKGAGVDQQVCGIGDIQRIPDFEGRYMRCGSENAKRVPWLRSDCTRTTLPCNSTMRLTMASPRPALVPGCACSASSPVRQ